MIKTDRHIDQWNGIKNLKTAPHKYGQFIFDKGVKQVKEGRLVFNKWCLSNWTSKEMSFNLSLTLYNKLTMHHGQQEGEMYQSPSHQRVPLSFLSNRRKGQQTVQILYDTVDN